MFSHPLIKNLCAKTFVSRNLIIRGIVIKLAASIQEPIVRGVKRFVFSLTSFCFLWLLLIQGPNWNRGQVHQVAAEQLNVPQLEWTCRIVSVRLVSAYQSADLSL